MSSFPSHFLTKLSSTYSRSTIISVMGQCFLDIWILPSISDHTDKLGLRFYSGFKCDGAQHMRSGYNFAGC